MNDEANESIIIEIKKIPETIEIKKIFEKKIEIKKISEKNNKAKFDYKSKRNKFKHTDYISPNAYFLDPSWIEYYTKYELNPYEITMRELQLNQRKGVGPEVNPMYISQTNLALCLIPKNGITVWKMVVLRMIFPQSEEKWWVLKPNKLPSSATLKKIKLIPKNFEKDKIKQIYNDTNVKFYVIIRDPLERALSGYIYFSWYFKLKSFAYFPDYLFKLRNAAKHIDHHVREQHLFCDLDHSFKRYKTIDFNDYNARKTLLLDLGDDVWETIGRYGWHPALHEAINDKLRRDKSSKVDFRNYSRDPTVYEKIQSLTDYGSPSYHAKFANKKVLQFYTVYLIKELLKFYQRDYQLFQLKLPYWICNVVANQLNQPNRDRHLYKELDELVTYINTAMDENIFTINQYPECFDELAHCVGSKLEDCGDMMLYTQSFTVYNNSHDE